jgi:hypothetical protein
MQDRVTNACQGVVVIAGGGIAEDDELWPAVLARETRWVVVGEMGGVGGRPFLCGKRDGGGGGLLAGRSRVGG